jgi:hypothetical protein
MCAARRESTTVPGTCPACGDEVYVHTDGAGKQVLFDELGPPWPIHPCAHKVVAPELSPSSSQSSVASARESRRDITRCDPAEAGPALLQRKGCVTDIHPGRSLATLARPGTLEYERLYEIIGSARFTQFTLIDADHVSYTLWLPDPHRDIGAGAVIEAAFRAHEVAGRTFFAVKSLR